MSNMSYCRFENTCYDLQDCKQAILDNVSEREEKFRERLIKLCREIIATVDEDEQARLI